LTCLNFIFPDYLGFSQSTINIQSNPVIENVSNEICEPLYQNCASEWLVLPSRPIFLNFFQFVYLTNRSENKFKDNIAPDFVCFNAKKCLWLAANVVPIEIINGLTCCRLSNLIETTVIRDFYAAARGFSKARNICLTTGIEKSCRNSSYFYCNQSMKCISKHRVRDGRYDCYFREDEWYNTYESKDSNRFQRPSDLKNYLSPIAISDELADWNSRENEVLSYKQLKPIHNLFLELCDLTINYGPIKLPEGEETDETNCDWWPCANPYTRCNYFFDCLDGSDELNCSDSICSFNEFDCHPSQFESYFCLSKDHLYDKYLDPCQNTYILSREYY
jgi:hypothetical protein